MIEDFTAERTQAPRLSHGQWKRVRVRASDQVFARFRCPGCGAVWRLEDVGADGLVPFVCPSVTCSFYRLVRLDGWRGKARSI